MQERHFIAAGAINMFIAVAAGAFGAHALKPVLSPELLAIWQTAATYQMVHALGLIAIAVLIQLMPHYDVVWLRRAGWLMLAGILLFSGSLYALALSGVRMLGAITPFGGLSFLSGWALLAWTASRRSA
ncbi:DUF423 domain-containing protein [soil metagenome]